MSDRCMQLLLLLLLYMWIYGYVYMHVLSYINNIRLHIYECLCMIIFEHILELHTNIWIYNIYKLI